MKFHMTVGTQQIALEPRTPSRFLDELPEPPVIERRDRESPPTEDEADAKADESGLLGVQVSHRPLIL